VRHFRAAVVWATAGALAAVLAAVVLPLAFGARPFTVMSGSMEPAIDTGDVVVIKSIPPSQARLGDVVTFRDPRHPERLLTHRVRGLRFDHRQSLFVTKGDAATQVERWKVARDGHIGRALYRLPKLGHLALAVQTPLLRMLAIIIPALLLALLAIVWIWRPSEPEPEASLPGPPA
jgi:signal peptidase